MPARDPFRRSGCDDFHHTTRAVRAGALRRREVVLGGMGLGLGLYAAHAMPAQRVLEAAAADAATAPDAPVLVSVFLPGGLDLLATLPPLDRAGKLNDLRVGGLRVADVLKLGGPAGDLGLHPKLSAGAGGGIRGLFDRGQIGFLPGIDYANPDLSHFNSRHFWETGMITTDDLPGWLGRYLDRRGGADNPLQGLCLSGSLSPVLRSARAPVAAVSSPSDARLHFAGTWGKGEAAARAAWTELGRDAAARAGRRPGPQAVARSVALAQQVSDRLSPFAPQDEKAPDPLGTKVAYPEKSEFAERLRVLAGLIAQPLGIRVATIDAPGDFDTHDDQPQTLDRILEELSAGLSAFQADLEQRGVAQRVLTFVWSEFGRRPEGNDSQGTDHGAGGVAWVQGPRAAGGILTEYPSLDKLDRDDNLAVTVDFRRVYASLLEQWLGTGADEVLPGAASFGRLKLVR